MSFFLEHCCAILCWISLTHGTQQLTSPLSSLNSWFYFSASLEESPLSVISVVSQGLVRACVQTPTASKASALRQGIYVWVWELILWSSSSQVRPSFPCPSGLPRPPLAWLQSPVSQGCAEIFSSPFIALSLPGSLCWTYGPHPQDRRAEGILCEPLHGFSAFHSKSSQSKLLILWPSLPQGMKNGGKPRQEHHNSHCSHSKVTYFLLNKCISNCCLLWVNFQSLKMVLTSWSSFIAVLVGENLQTFSFLNSWNFCQLK